MTGLFGAGFGSSIILVESRAAAEAPRTPVRQSGPRVGLLVTTALAGALLVGLPDWAQAQSNNACGAVDANGSVTCTPAGNPFADGIRYDSTVRDLSVVLADDVTVERDPRRATSSLRLATTTGKLTLRSGDNVGIVSTGDYQNGVTALSTTGTLDLAAPYVVTLGFASTGVRARTTSGAIVAKLGTIETQGSYSDGAWISNQRGGDITVEAGDIRTFGDRSLGLQVLGNGPGATSVTVSGNVATAGAFSTGVNVSGSYYGDPVLVSTRGIETKGDFSTGIQVAGRSIGVEINGDIRTSGAVAEGVRLVAFDGPLAATMSGNIDTTGDYANGAVVYGNGDVAVQVSGAITTAGAGASGVRAVTSAGNMIVNLSQVGTAGDDANAVETRNSDATGTTLVLADEIVTLGARSAGVNLTGTGSAVAVIDTLTTSGDGATGVDAATSPFGDVLASAGAVINTGSTSGVGANLVTIRVRGEAALESAGLLSVSGAGSTILSAQAGEAIRIAVNDAVVSGTDSRGIVAVTPGTIEAAVTGRFTGTADQSVPGTAMIDLTGGAGVTLANSGAISTSGFGEAAVLLQSAGPVTVSGIGTIATTGAGASGLVAGSQYGSVSIAQSAVSTTGDQSAAIVAQGGTGVDVGVGTVTTRGVASDAIAASSYGTVSVASTGTIGVAGAGSAGVRASGSDVAVVLNTMTVAGAGSLGVAVMAANSASVTVTGSVTGNADQVATTPRPLPLDRVSDVSTGIISVAANGAASVANGGTIATTGQNQAGITVRGGGNVVVSGNGRVMTSGAGATGIYAGSSGTLASVTQASVSTTGDNARGVLVRSYGAGSATVGTVTTTGAGSRGISVESVSGARIVAGTVTTSGAGAVGIEAQSFGPATVTATNVTTTGVGATGIYAAATQQGDAAITVSGTVSVQSSHAAAAISYFGTASVTVANARKAGDTDFAALLANGGTGASVAFGTLVSNTDGIASGTTPAAFALTSAGTASVSGGTASVTGQGNGGVAAVSYAGNATIAMTGAVSTTGARGHAVVVEAQGGLARVSTASVSTTGAGAAGIIASGNDAVVTATGPVTVSGVLNTSGRGIAAVDVAALTGQASVSVGSVSATGAGADAVNVRAATNAALTVVSGATIAGNRDAVVLASRTGGTLTNAGTIAGGSGAAVRVTGGAATIVNTGTIIGALVLTDQADSVTNGGRLTLASGTSFGAGNDTLANSGTLLLAGDVAFGDGTDLLTNSGTLALTGGTTARSRSVTGLERLANSGLIDLRSGIAGDTLTTSGAFVGSGNSTLALDVNFASGVADRLIVGGATTGSTALVVNPVTTGDAVLVSGITLVQTGSGTASDAFTLAAGSQARGFIQYGLVANTANTAFTLVGAPAPTAYKVAKIGEGVQSASMDSADAVTAHLANVRDAAAPDKGLWYQARGGVVSRHELGLYSTSGFAQSVDLGYKQDGFGGQGGFDIATGGGALRFGVTGGYESSMMAFAASADRVHLDVLNGGVYAGLHSGAVFVNALAKYDRYVVRTNFASLGVKDRFHGSSWGGRVEAGLRLGNDGFYVEPAVRVTYLDTSLDTTGAYGAEIGLIDGHSVRGEAGLRLGGMRDIGGGTMMTIYASGNAVKTFDAANRFGFVTGSSAVAIETDRLPVYGVGKLGMAVSSGRVTGFIEGEGRYSDAYRGGGGRVGLRIGF
ncbi:autotransporter outer membrane beta-barrel domain-containing protein [Sphingomonas sp. Leaf17]|uniref:autotransporter outer membrane beta-barrel domain-containing protein n=1 Tax=Sphingomonas sp. Leaf17 TaxID=1735683 RepID=UPI000A4FCE94|nr:autotransporter outer membrane beta-barrel domain-containing protein [Sphingomonas sp. Leaf17]